MKCSVEGCSREAEHLGMCSAHYQRKRYKGDVLAHIPIKLMRASPLDVMLQHVEVSDTGCWLWTGYIDKKGYGRSGGGGEGLSQFSHKRMYQLLVGEVPEGSELDHLCFNRACCNPMHLEPVKHRVNIQRSVDRRECCPYGHPYTEDNLVLIRDRKWGLVRKCKRCRDIAQMKRFHKRRDKIFAKMLMELPVIQNQE